MESFPGCVDNSLILQPVASASRKHASRWERPITIITSPDLSQQWVETLDSPAVHHAQPNDVGRYSTINYRGGEIKDSNPSAPWIQKITPDSPFEAGYVRVMIATKSTGIRIIRTTLGDAIHLLSSQNEKQTMRLDGMVPPNGPSITITSKENAPMEYSIGNQSYFSKTTANAFTIESNGEWQRFSVFFRAPNKQSIRRIIHINGTPHW